MKSVKQFFVLWIGRLKLMQPMIVSTKFTFMPEKMSSNTMHDPMYRCDTVPLTQLLKTLVSIIIRMYRVLHNLLFLQFYNMLT